MLTWNVIAEILTVLPEISSDADDYLTGDLFDRLCFVDTLHRVDYMLAMPMRTDGEGNVASPWGHAYGSILRGPGDRAITFCLRGSPWDVMISLQDAMSGGPVRTALRYWENYDSMYSASLTLHRHDTVAGVQLGEHYAFPDFTMKADVAENRANVGARGSVWPRLIKDVFGLFSPIRGGGMAWDRSGIEPFPYVIIGTGYGYAVTYAAVEPGTRISLDGDILSGELYRVRFDDYYVDGVRKTILYPEFDFDAAPPEMRRTPKKPITPRRW